MVNVEYIHSISKKIIGAAAMIFNTHGEILIVKPNYRDDWLLPGGSVEEFESPKEGCVREIKEEVGLNITDLQFAGVFHGTATTEEGVKYEALQFVFHAGAVGDEHTKQIVLQEKELTEYRFVSTEEALSLLAFRSGRRMTMSLEAFKKGSCVYAEFK